MLLKFCHQGLANLFYSDTRIILLKFSIFSSNSLFFHKIMPAVAIGKLILCIFCYSLYILKPLSSIINMLATCKWYKILINLRPLKVLITAAIMVSWKDYHFCTLSSKSESLLYFINIIVKNFIYIINQSFLFLEIVLLFWNYSLCFEVFIILEIIPT